MANLNKKFYLGVEGGATKSMAILVDENDSIVMQRTAGALNYHSEGEENTRQNLISLLAPILRKAKKGKIYAVLGLAGIDTKKDAILHRRLVKSILPKNSVFRVVNDAESGIEAKCPGEKHRILVIAGTGSNVYGESEGKIAKSVGWEHILGDEGSAYDIGEKILRAATQSWDGRSNKTILERLVLQQSNSQTLENLMDKIDKISLSEQRGINPFVASFGPLLNKAIEQNDQIALQIREETTKELVKGVVAVVNRLNLADQEFCIGLVGSVWKMPDLQETFQRAVQQQFLRARFSQRKEEGAWGGVLLAKKLAQ